MAVYFVDSSASAKRYIAEAGSLWLRSLLNPTTGCTTYIARITQVEIIAAITRRERGGTLASADADNSRTYFRSDLADECLIVEITPTLAHQATRLAESRGLPVMTPYSWPQLLR